MVVRAPSRGVLVATAVAAGAAVVTLATLLIVGWGPHHSSAQPPASARTGPTTAAALDAPALARRVSPSIVSIETPATSSAPATVAGSGLVLSSTGLVLTTADVVGTASTVEVVLADGRTAPADLVASQPDADVALVRIRGASGFTPVTIGRSSGVQGGDAVVAVGAATGAGGPRPAAEGVVSALAVSMPTAGATVGNLIRSDAATVPPEAGGPLLDAQGQVVGLTVVVTGGAPGVGYAMATDSIRSVIQQLEQGHGAVTAQSATLGVQTTDVGHLTPAQISRYGVLTSDGALVTEIDKRSSATNAGLQVGDVITALDAQPVNTGADLTGAVQSDHAGQRVTITFERRGQIRNATVVLLSQHDTGN